MNASSLHKSDIEFSGLNRSTELSHASTTQFDLIVIGGGITGAGIVMDATLRGLKTLLIEKGDFASGTSSKSTKLIHGGLRYLKQLEFGLVKESGLERAVAHNNVPHLVHPEKMLLPIVKGGTFSHFMASMAISMYDLLAGVKSEDRKQSFNRQQTLVNEPTLKDTLLKSGIAYSEYRTDDARLTIELIKNAKRHGAQIFNYCELVDFKYEDGSITGILANDHFSNQEFEFNARHVVSAAGPWVDLLREKDESKSGKSLHLTKGVHIVVPHSRLPVKSAVYFDAFDGRMIFAVPRGIVTYIGTTDTSYTGDLNRVLCTKEDARYLLDKTNRMFNIDPLTMDDIESTWAGLRPLIGEEGKSASEISRKDEIFISDRGLISIAGGKLTGFRKMAKRIVDLVYERDTSKDFVECKTKKHPVHADSYTDYESFQKDVENTCEKFKAQLSQYQIWHLLSTYGKHAHTILNEALKLDEGDFEAALLLAEIDYTLKYESALYPIDFIDRRSSRLFFDIQSVHKHKDLIINRFSEYYGWSAEEKELVVSQTLQKINDVTEIR